MGKTKKVGITGRFGARGGATLRKRRAEVEKLMKMPHRCPRCLSQSVGRQSIGVWICYRCGYTFAGGAYLPVTKLGTTEKRIRELSSAR